MLSLLLAIKALRFCRVLEAREMDQPLANRQDPVYRLQRHDVARLRVIRTVELPRFPEALHERKLWPRMLRLTKCNHRRMLQFDSARRNICVHHTAFSRYKKSNPEKHGQNDPPQTFPEAFADAVVSGTEVVKSPVR